MRKWYSEPTQTEGKPADEEKEELKRRHQKQDRKRKNRMGIVKAVDRS